MSWQMLSTDALIPARWDSFVSTHPTAHVLQSSRWGELKARFGWQLERVGLAQRNELVAGAQVLFRRLPWGQSLAYVPKGLLVEWNDAAQVEALLEAIERVARRHRAVALKIEPELSDDVGMGQRLAGYGFHPGHTVQPRSTIIIDLAPDLDSLLSGMKSKWRYNVRLSSRKGVTVRAGIKEDLPSVQALFDETAHRDEFAVHSSAYYAAAYRLFATGSAPALAHSPAAMSLEEDGLGPEAEVSLQPGGEAVWLLAEHEGQLLAAIVVFAMGERAWYFWGASSNEQRHLMPNHALQWAAIRWAKRRGCREYDLWGIPDEVGRQPAAYEDAENWGSGGLWGVYRFKQGFGGRVERTIGAWDRVYSPVGYRLYQAAIAVRRGLD